MPENKLSLDPLFKSSHHVRWVLKKSHFKKWVRGLKGFGTTALKHTGVSRGIAWDRRTKLWTGISLVQVSSWLRPQQVALGEWLPLGLSPPPATQGRTTSAVANAEFLDLPGRRMEVGPRGQESEAGGRPDMPIPTAWQQAVS